MKIELEFHLKTDNYKDSYYWLDNKKDNLSILRRKPRYEQFREQHKGRGVAIFRIKKTKDIKQVPLARNEQTENAQGLFILPSMPSSFKSHTRWQSKVFLSICSQIDITRNVKENSSKFYDKTFFPY